MTETIFMSSSYNKQLKKQPSGNYYARADFISRPTDQNKAPTNVIHAGLLFPPTTPLNLSASLPVPFYRSYQEPQQPLLPLPPPKSLHASLPCRIPNMSSSPTTNRSKINRNREHSLTPKKSKPKKMMSEKSEERKTKADSKPTKAVITTQDLVIESIGPLGPDPKDLPRDVISKVLSPSPSTVWANGLPEDFDEFSGSVFTLAPPPSSLPLPNFSLRPKGSCNAEAAKIDPGATDGLRRLLRLR